MTSIPLWVHPLLATASFLLTLVFVSSILRARRTPGSTLAWLFLILVLPYVGIPIYLLLSGRKFTGRRGSKAKIYRSRASVDSLESLNPTQRILHFSGFPEARANRAIELLPSGQEAFRKILESIGGARKSIHVTTFIFGNDAVGATVTKALVEKAAEGVEVRVLIDAVGAKLSGHPDFGSLKKNGGLVEYFMPILHLPFRGRTNLRNHRKLLLIDGKSAILGGMNLAQEYMGPTPDKTRWVDLALHLEGDCVRDLEEVFLHDWAYACHEEVRLPKFEASAPDERRLLAQVVASGPDVVGDSLYDILLNAIHGAKKSVRIVTPYFIPDESLTKALELVAKRGVEVHIVIPRKSNHPLADLARGTFVRQLESFGVQFGLHSRMIHAKAVLVDDSLGLLGSANFDMRSLLLNYELGVAIYSPQVCQEIGKWILERHRETTRWVSKPGFWRETGEGIGRVVGPLL
jgi:cardiolipin synthase